MILIAIGIIIGLQNLDILLIDNWWALFILIPALGAHGGGPKGPERIRLEDLREDGDTGQDANLVIGLSDDALEGAGEERKSTDSSVADLRVTILKNRNGPANQEALLRFDKPVLKITERGRTLRSVESKGA